MTNQVLENKTSKRSIWMRGLYMLLFLLVHNVAEAAMVAVALFQFVTQLLTGETNQQVRVFGQSLSLFVFQIWRFLTFNSEDLPFPFAPWPEGNTEQASTH